MRTKTAWEHVQQKASEKFLGAECHDLRASAIGVILPAELDDTVNETHEPGV
jgi:hypothetical protein